jgi:hypothetical protein
MPNIVPRQRRDFARNRAARLFGLSQNSNKVFKKRNTHGAYEFLTLSKPSPDCHSPKKDGRHGWRQDLILTLSFQEIFAVCEMAILQSRLELEKFALR